ncbi:3',5'-cyclic-AMP phosphodiesterase [Vibrio mangrovi]|uniref:3',5'-cyclic adenosine monophosphate phosphodiesterase CpdA n=1 Tax=Vibrio mangrovi TaxID=474394 RepID=A0A1Y6IUB3_9VIBR|nr:3',5'-cyclic-AMP phosphodiesterase [Vibrio mangrovi]MDW6002974.1 3',5'-cyclic-AMP phosphodiesterase [Vibrio mangrovi]SMS01216.1 3',5'-cyclic adenosine monophosphate phosphodiesterase CpdA [Vibrio mangrovi]
MDVSFHTEHLDSVKLLQITDTHLFASDEGSLLSVNTADSFNAVVDEIISRQVEYHLILATGDISQDHSDVSYQRFVDGIQPLQKPCLWLPGNHDDQPVMKTVLACPQITQPNHVIVGAHWQMILLDSQVFGVPYGHVSPEQLQQMDDILCQTQDRHTLILLHHHPLLVGSRWLDQHTLKNSEQFWDVLLKYPHVKGVICGHVHQVMERDYHGVRVMSTPSTCVQFKPQSDDFALDSVSPGWRELELHPDGQLTTQVGRLKSGLFLPDFSAHGY